VIFNFVSLNFIASVLNRLIYLRKRGEMMKIGIQSIKLQILAILALIISSGIFAGCTTTKTSATQSSNNQTNTVSTNKTAELTASPNQTKDKVEIEPKTNETPKTTTKESKIDGIGSKGISKTNFDKINEGMSYKEVATLLEDEGMKVAIMKVNGRSTEIYKWSNADFSVYIDVTFENDKVVEKKQKGL
jgi:hypothetical protein